MKEFRTVYRSWGVETGSTGSFKDFTIAVPKFCPICNEPQTPMRVSGDSFAISDKPLRAYGIVLYECTGCGARYLAIFHGHEEMQTEFRTFYPLVNKPYEDDLFKDISPRYINMYQQAQASEDNENIELAAIGYRSALEFLAKDYLIKVKNVPEKDVIKSSLSDIIEKYFKESITMYNSADVVRILGNDYTHYKEKYPDKDFAMLKKYLKYFILFLQIEYEAMNPPVERVNS